MRILITGANGLLGQKVVDYCLAGKIEFVASSKGENRNSKCPSSNYTELDITDRLKVLEVIESMKPTHIVHTAAMTNVDACETDPEACHSINVLGTKYLSEGAELVGAHFQLLSTDFVFDGEKGNYVETDAVNPLSEYAKSKVEAEQIVTDLQHDNWSIVRTIIVYGSGENLTRSNIVAWAKSALEKGDPLNIVDDQYRAPTFAEDLAQGCMLIIEKSEKGIFHISGPETMSIFELVTRIGEHFNYDVSVLNKISSKTLSQAAQRPPKTGFDLTKSYKLLGYKPHTLEESLDVLF